MAADFSGSPKAASGRCTRWPSSPATRRVAKGCGTSPNGRFHHGPRLPSSPGRAAATVAAGLVLCGLAALVLMIAWPSSRWTAGISDFASPHRLAIMVLANCVVLVAAYLAAATLVWTIADATMAQPRDLDQFHVRPDGGRTWRIAHLSDIHVVGERYGYRIESGRSGPRGNERLRQALMQLEILDANDSTRS